MRRSIVGTILGLVLGLPAVAQDTAAITGKVQDATGAAIADAKITVKSLETGAIRETISGADGNFRILSLPLGGQEVKAEKPGFRSVVRTGVSLEVGQEAVLTLQLEVGEVAESVTVVGGAPLVNTTPSSVSGMVGGESVKALPLNGRSYDNLITLNPGTINYTSMKTVNTTTSDGNSFSVAGRRPQDNLFLLNGIEYTGTSQLAVTPGGVSGYLLGIDAVREFNLLTDTYGAQYGKRTGGQVLVVTQSGSNTLHGTLFEFLRNSALDQGEPVALDPVDKGNAPPFRRNQFGAALGGPVKTDRFFLFGNYEGFRQSLATNSVSEVPDAYARQGLLPNAQGSYVPAAKLNPAMLPFTALWPQANGPELLVNGLPTGTALAYYNPKNTIHEDYGTLRADYNLRAADRLSAVYTLDTGTSVIPLPDPLFASSLMLSSQVGSLEETHVISPSVLNTFRAGFSRAGFNFNSATLTSFPPSLSFVAGDQPGNIAINGGITTAGDSSNAGAWNRRNLFTVTDGLEIAKGIHQLSVGVWFQRVQDNEDVVSKRLGGATFSTLATFLQGNLVNFQVVPDHTELGWRSFFGAWYVQDEIKLRRNLTLQAGLRDEFTTGWNEGWGRAANYITNGSGVLLTAPHIGNAIFTKNNAARLLGPRLGVAWDPFGNGKTAVRAGFGLYYSLIDALSFLLNDLPPYNGAVTLTGSLPSLLPITPNVPVPPSCGPGVPSPCTIFAPYGVPPDGQTPTVAEWNFSVQQQISANMALRVAYAGSHGYHGLLSIDANSTPAQICAGASGCVAGGDLATTSVVPQGAQYVPVGGRPNPYLSAGFFWYTEGNNSYNALQLDLTRRLSRGLQLRAAYTWSKNLDINSGLTGAQSDNQAQMVMNRNDLPRDWGPSALNVAHQLNLSATYALPRLAASHGVEGKFFGGWQLNSIVTLQTGFPFTPLTGGNQSGDGDTRNPDRPSLKPSFSGPVVLGRQAQWFNPAAFLPPSAGTWGNVGRGVYTGPGLADVDFSVFKNVSVSERAHVQLRAEFFNLLNRANLGTPNATVFSGAAISPTAGLITTLTTTPRQIQMGLKVTF
ncbi:MAG TPA: carboxypeptidase-like regulatory domain-containing protein [Bryobacteraceae bacterium]|jgi:hypothetical protein